MPTSGNAEERRELEIQMRAANAETATQVEVSARVSIPIIQALTAAPRAARNAARLARSLVTRMNVPKP